MKGTDVKVAAALAFLAVMAGFVSYLYGRHRELVDRCEAKGGHVFGGPGDTGRRLCLSDDGRIIDGW